MGGLDRADEAAVGASFGHVLPVYFIACLIVDIWSHGKSGARVDGREESACGC